MNLLYNFIKYLISIIVYLYVPIKFEIELVVSQFPKFEKMKIESKRNWY